MQWSVPVPAGRVKDGYRQLTGRPGCAAMSAGRTSGREVAVTQPAGITGPVGFVGLGVMGSAMSAHLIEAGHHVIGYDVAAAARDAHAARGGVVAGSPAEVAGSAGLVVTSLPSAAALADVLGGPGGLAAGAARGAGLRGLRELRGLLVRGG